MKDTEKTNTLTLRILEGADGYHGWIFKNIKPYLGANVLEVGCGTGNLTGLLLSQGKVVATDVNEGYLHAVESKHGGHPNLKGTLIWDIRQDPPKSLGLSVDSIVCSNVLEHIENDDHVLKTFYHLLPAGGTLIVLVPALKTLYNSFDRELGHFRRYGKNELIRKISGGGFQVMTLRYFNFFGIFGWFVNGTLLRRRLLPERQVRVFDKMVPLFMTIEKVIPALAGQSLIAVGRKARKPE